MALERVPGGWRVRLRFGVGRRGRFAMPDMPKARAEDRAERLERMARRLGSVGPATAKSALEEAARAGSEKDFASCERAIYELAREARKEASGGEKTRYTFRDVAELWLSGELRERYPDDVPKKSARSVGMDRGLFAVLYPAIGELDVTKITREDCEAAKRLIPAGLRQSSRQRYAALIKRVMDLAVLMGLIDHSPVPRKFVPPAGKPRARPFLYPDEDAALMRCHEATAPLGERIAWGFMTRNGCRPGETKALTRGDFDLDRGTVSLDENKTDDPRSWALDEDVVRALRRYWGDETDADLPAFPAFVLQQGARRLRSVLRACGIGRKHLTLSTELRGPMNLHGLRGTFVTVALASGKTETWVMRRTGHTTSAMVARYRRQVEALELRGDWFSPLDSLLWPDGVGHEMGHGPQKPGKKGTSHIKGESALGASAQQPEPPEAVPEKSTAPQSGAAHAEDEGVGQDPPGPPTEYRGTERPVERKGTSHAPATLKGVRDELVQIPEGASGAGTGEEALPSRSGPDAPADPLVRALTLALELAVQAQDLDRVALIVAELSLSIRLAAEAGQWDLAARLHTQLDRVTARAADVASIDAARRRKNGDR